MCSALLFFVWFVVDPWVVFPKVSVPIVLTEVDPRRLLNVVLVLIFLISCCRIDGVGEGVDETLICFLVI